MLSNEIVIENHEDLLAAVIAILFSPKKIGEDSIEYDKESIYGLLDALEEVFEMWYNIPLGLDIEKENHELS